MPAASKPRQGSYRDDAARARLADAKAELAALQVDLQAAETVRDAALGEYGAARGTVDEIQDRITALATQWRTAGPMQREDLQRKVDDAQLPLQDAKRALMPLDIEVERAEAAVRQIEQRIGHVRGRASRDAEAVLRAEAPQVVEVHVARLRDAFATIATYGPDLAYLLDSQLVPRELADPLGDSRSLLNACQSWDTFARRYRSTAWRGAVAALEADPDAVLPSLPLVTGD